MIILLTLAISMHNVPKSVSTHPDNPLQYYCLQVYDNNNNNNNDNNNNNNNNNDKSINSTTIIICSNNNDCIIINNNNTHNAIWYIVRALGVWGEGECGH